MTLRQQVQEFEYEFFAPEREKQARRKRIADLKNRIKEADEFVFFAYLRRAKGLIDGSFARDQRLDRLGCQIMSTVKGINHDRLVRLNIDNLIRAKARRRNEAKEAERQARIAKAMKEKAAKLEAERFERKIAQDQKRLEQIKVSEAWTRRHFERNPSVLSIRVGGRLIRREDVTQ